MNKKKQTRLIHEKDYVAEVEVELIESDDAWAPYLSLEEAKKLDTVRTALERGDLAQALKLARVYRLTPVTGA